MFAVLLIDCPLWDFHEQLAFVVGSSSEANIQTEIQIDFHTGRGGGLFFLSLLVLYDDDETMDELHFNDFFAMREY